MFADHRAMNGGHQRCGFQEHLQPAVVEILGRIGVIGLAETGDRGQGFGRLQGMLVTAIPGLYLGRLDPERVERESRAPLDGRQFDFAGLNRGQQGVDKPAQGRKMDFRFGLECLPFFQELRRVLLSHRGQGIVAMAAKHENRRAGLINACLGGNLTFSLGQLPWLHRVTTGKDSAKIL